MAGGAPLVVAVSRRTVIWRNTKGEPVLWKSRRVVRTLSGSGQPYYTAERYEPCPCPDCEKGAHWVQSVGSPDPADALKAGVR